MTATTLDHPAPTGSVPAAIRIVLAVAVAALLLVAFVSGRATAPEGSSSSSGSAPVAHVTSAELGQPVESCPAGQAC